MFFFQAFTITIICLVCVSQIDAFVPSLQRYYFKAQLRDACVAKDENKIGQFVEELTKLNPTTDIRREFSKLNGEWKLDYTTAPVSEVPDETSGVKTYQTIDTAEGIIYNVIDRGLPKEGAKIAVGIEATRSDRVALDFRTIEAFNERLPNKSIVLSFPPRNLIKVVYKIGKFFKGQEYDELEFKEATHFDLLYLDDDLRIQRNSEGNLFVNSK